MTSRRAKYLKRILGGLILAPICLILLVALLLYVPPVQNIVVQHTAAYLSEKTRMQVSVGRVHLAFPLDLSLEKLQVLRSPGDTLVTVGALSLSPSLRPLFDKQVEVPRIALSDLTYHQRDSLGLSLLDVRLPEATAEQLFVDLKQERVDLNRLTTQGGFIRYYSTDTTKKPEEESEPLRWIIRAGELDFQSTRIEVAMPLDSLLLQTDIDRFKVERSEADLGKMRFQIAHTKVDAKSLRYSVDEHFSKLPFFDPQHVLLHDLHLESEDIDSEGMRLSLLLRHAQLREQSGLKLLHLGGRYQMDSVGMRLDGLDLITDASSIKGYLSMPWSLLNSDRKAQLELSTTTSLGMKDLLLFAGKTLQETPGGRELFDTFARRGLLAPLKLQAELTGTLTEIQIRQAEVKWPNILDLSLSGTLSEVLEQHRSGRLKLRGRIGHKANTLLSLLSPQQAKTYRIPSPLLLSGDVDIRRGHYQGDLTAEESTGKLHVKGQFTEATQTYDLAIKAQDIDGRHFMPHDSIGRVSMEVALQGRGFDPLSPRTQLSIHGRLHEANRGSLHLRDITLDGSLQSGNLTLSVNSMNPGANFTLQLDGIFSRQSINTGIGLELVDLDLQRLGFSSTPLSAKLRLEGELRTDLKDTHTIQAALDGMSFRMDGEKIAPPRAELQLTTSPRDIQGALTSGDMKANLSVASSPTIAQKEVSLLLEETLRQIGLITSGKSATKHLEDLAVHLPKAVFSLSMGKDNPLRYYLAEQRMALGALKAHFSTSPEEGLSGSLALSDLRLDTLRINAAQLNISTERTPIARGDSMSLVLFGSVMKSRFREQEGFTISTDLRTSLQGGHLDFSYQDERGQLQHSAEIAGSWSGEAYQLHFLGDRLRLAYNDYAINTDNQLSLRKRDNFLLGSLKLSGGPRGEFELLGREESPGVQDITLGIRNLHIEDYRSLGLPDVGGTLFGDVHYQRKGDLKQQPTISGDLSISGLRYEDKKLGYFTTSLFYEPRSGDSHYITAEVGYNGHSAMSIDGIYYPREKTSPLKGTLTLNAFPLELANPFLAANSTALTGTAEGSINLSGKLTEPRLSGQVHLNQAMLHLNAYATHLALDSIPVRLEGSDVFFDHYALRPSVDPKKAIYIDGSIHKSTSPEASASLRITSDELTLLNEPRPTRDDQLLYGKIIASTRMTATGPLTALRVRGSMNVLSGTNCTYILREDPLTAGDKKDQLVQFVDFADTLFTKKVEVAPTSLGGLDVNLTINVDPSVRVGADLTAGGSDYLHAQGGGTLHFTYPPYGEMSMTGRYEMSGGGELSYTLPVVGNKLFTIDPTSSLSWTGPITNPYLNFTAVNKVKASVASSSGNAQRVNFNVSILIKDYVTKMNLGFGLSAPENLSVQNSISTMTKEEQGKQAIALMATGMYLAGGSGAGNLDLNSALTSLLQSQINKTAGMLLQGTDLNLGLDRYDGASGEAAHTDLTYSFSRRFYNDRIRIVVGGKVQSGAGATNQGQTFLDNVSLKYQLDKTGEQYLSLYHKLVTDNVLEGEFSETGVGYVLRRKLSSLLDLFGRKKKPTAASSIIRRQTRKPTLIDSSSRPRSLVTDTIAPLRYRAK